MSIRAEVGIYKKNVRSFFLGRNFVYFLSFLVKTVFFPFFLNLTFFLVWKRVSLFFLNFSFINSHLFSFIILQLCRMNKSERRTDASHALWYRWCIILRVKLVSDSVSEWGRRVTQTCDYKFQLTCPLLEMLLAPQLCLLLGTVLLLLLLTIIRRLCC